MEKVDIRLYSKFGRVLCVVLLATLFLAVALISVNSGVLDAIAALPLAISVSWAALVLFWLPELRVSEKAVTVKNVWLEINIPWSEIEQIDTKYALTLLTKHGRVAVWSAPAPGRHSAFNATRDQGRHLPESTYYAGTIRPGDLPNSESGSAAAIVRREWEARRGRIADTDEIAWSKRVRLPVLYGTIGICALLGVSLLY